MEIKEKILKEKEIRAINKQLNILYGVTWARKKDDEDLFRVLIDVQQIISNYINHNNKK